MNDTIDSRRAFGLPRIARFGFGLQRAIARWMKRLLALADRVGADRFLELEDEAGADRLDDRGRAALLAVLRVGEVAVLVGVDVRDRAAARACVGTRVAEQRALRRRARPGVPGPPMNLCGERKTASL